MAGGQCGSGWSGVVASKQRGGSAVCEVLVEVVGGRAGGRVVGGGWRHSRRLVMRKLSLWLAGIAY